MTTADDLRDLRDALDSIAHGALPRWGATTTKLGGEAQAAARVFYTRFVRALHQENAAKFAVEKAEMQTSDLRCHCEVLTARCEAAEAEIERVRAEWQRDLDGCNTIIDRLKARLGDK
jgi:hypothetical protein